MWLMFIRSRARRQVSLSQSGISMRSNTGSLEPSNARETHCSIGVPIGARLKRPPWLTNLWFSSDNGSINSIIGSRPSSKLGPLSSSTLFRFTAFWSSAYTARNSQGSDVDSSKVKYAAAKGDRVQSSRGVAKPKCCPRAHHSFSCNLAGLLPRRPLAAYLNASRCFVDCLSSSMGPNDNSPSRSK